MNEITETNDIVQHHKTQLETNSGLNPGHYYFIMSKFKITKARSGGPIFNTQIYKSEPDPVTERDGMIGVFKKRWKNIDLPAHLEKHDFVIKPPIPPKSPIPPESPA